MKKGRKRHRGLPWERDCMDDLMTRNPLLFSTPPLHDLEKHPERWMKNRQLFNGRGKTTGTIGKLANY